jgi:hypothetical protein
MRQILQRVTSTTRGGPFEALYLSAVSAFLNPKVAVTRCWWQSPETYLELAAFAEPLFSTL